MSAHPERPAPRICAACGKGIHGATTHTWWWEGKLYSYHGESCCAFCAGQEQP